MEKQDFNHLLLKTVFSCMACDGDIDSKEIDLIKKMHLDSKVFGDINIDEALNQLLNTLKENGKSFFKEVFSTLSNTELSDEEELKIIESCIEIIKADDKIEYQEIKFFKVIRSKLNLSDERIISGHPDFEAYLESDVISDSYLIKLQEDFFSDGSYDQITGTSLIQNKISDIEALFKNMNKQ